MAEKFRGRHRRQHSPLGTRIDRRSLDERVWARRPVISEELVELSHDLVARAKRYGSQIIGLDSRLSVSLIYPEEVDDALRIRRRISPESIARVIFNQAQLIHRDNGREHVESGIFGVSVVGSSIGFDLDCPELIEDRVSLQKGINEKMGRRFVWSAKAPHITFARGNVGRLARAVESGKVKLPETVNLGEILVSYNDRTLPLRKNG